MEKEKLNNDVEIWKPALYFEDLYDVSNLGRVKNKKGRIIKSQVNNKGFETIKLYCNGSSKTYGLSRLVANSFIGDLKMVVKHKDGNPLNHRLENLTHLRMAESKRLKKGDKFTTTGKRILQTDKHGYLFMRHVDIKSASKLLKTSENLIQKAIDNKTELKGYYFYTEN